MEITKEQRKYAEKLADKIHDDKKSFGNRGANAQQKSREVTETGFLGEVIYADHKNLERPEFIQGKNDEGYDFKHNGETIDVKTSKKGKDLIIFPDKADDLPDRLVRVYIKNEDTAKITLDVTTEHFLQQCETKNLGYGDRLFLEADEQ